MPFLLASEGSVYQIVWMPLRCLDFLPQHMDVKFRRLQPKQEEYFNIKVALLSGRSLGEYSVHERMTLGFFLRNKLSIINASDRPTRAVLVSGEVEYQQASIRIFYASHAVDVYCFT